MESGDNRWLVVRWTLEISSLKVLMARLSFPPSLATRSLLENLRASRPLNDPSSREKRERERISSWNARRREITLERGITQLLRVMQAERGMRRCLPTALQGKLGPISLIRPPRLIDRSQGLILYHAISCDGRHRSPRFPSRSLYI